ncbi:ABC transporter ATP-binding protein [Adhaeretor mobilis]|uniref:Trehalose import ATP-binding protein SugC n=1 Tax=Adhaeretor mobilis TaxID=1930276 RepID=A0A517N1B8_9BACT|nr:sn-glycerol-3-phosphate ABC transporter ATP-binding protein UgpC [Adhaeretor mobilis]QDT00808.1 Trehalose import ATP-binding protein SugC [Adhaeretor mobilis]
MATVSFRNVNKVYPDGFHAVHDLNLEVKEGEFLVLVGPSGCGKSTTLRMLAGLEEISSGEIAIEDRVVNAIEPGDRDIAMVFQNYALYPHMSVRENLAFGLKMRRTPKQEIAERTAEVASTLGIESLLDRRPRELSGGQRQRVALGRAIVRQPKVFLFDEPLSNLDAKLRVQMRAEIASLHHRLKTTMVYVTHDQVEAMTLGERIVIMNHGRIQQAAAPLELYRRPANRFVAGFIGSPPMNFLRGTLKDSMFQSEGMSIQLANVSNEALSHEGNVWLGFRAEDLVLNSDGPSLPEVELEVVEQMGHESIGYFTLLGERHSIRLPATSEVNPGSRIVPRLRPAGWHLFADDEEGCRFARENETAQV